MIDVKIDSPLEQVLAIVRLLRQDGYVQGIHFDFAFIPGEEDQMLGNLRSKYTKFTFYDEELAMMFALKYSS